MNRWWCEDSQYLQMDGKKIHPAPWSTLSADLPDKTVVIQQYTGLKDKNGVEIYEGDLLKVNKDHEAWILGQCLSAGPIPEYTKGEIKWLCEAWKICQRNIGAEYLSKYTCCHEHPAALEVIGNIFENKDSI